MFVVYVVMIMILKKEVFFFYFYIKLFKILIFIILKYMIFLGKIRELDVLVNFVKFCFICYRVLKKGFSEEEF